MPRFIFPSALEWLGGKINAFEAEAFGADPLEAVEAMKKLAGMFRSLIASGIDNDTVQDCFQQEMVDDGFFYDLEDGLIEDACPKNWSIGDCQWFLKVRLSIDLNTLDVVKGASETGLGVRALTVNDEVRLDCWRNVVAARIDDYDEDTDK